MKEFAYKNGSANLEFSLPCSKYSSSFKIDTGASLTALPASEFKNFFSSKDIMGGTPISLTSASGGGMYGYSHKVIVKPIGFDKNIIMDICFYNGLRGLLGMDMIKKHFQMCFKKDKFIISVN